MILNAVIHHVLDSERPHEIVAAYKDVMAPGSYMQFTHFTDEFTEAKANEAILRQALGRGQARSREEIIRFFDGLEILPPGIVFLSEWRSDEPLTGPLNPGGKLMLAGVGLKAI